MKCTVVKFIKPGMWSHFSESRDPSYFGSAMCPECPRKDWQGKSYWLHKQESSPEVDRGPGGVITSQSWLGFILVWSQRSYKGLPKTVMYSTLRPPRDAAPVTLPKGKASVKMNQLLSN